MKRKRSKAAVAMRHAAQKLQREFRAVGRNAPMRECRALAMLAAGLNPSRTILAPSRVR